MYGAAPTHTVLCCTAVLLHCLLLAGGAGAGGAAGVPPPTTVQQRQQRFVVSMRTAAQPVQAAFSNAVLAMQRRLQEQAAPNAARAAAPALREQAAAAGLRSVTSAPLQPQFLATVVVPEQVHPHRSAPFQARRVQVTSQQQLQHVLAQLQADFGGQMPQHQVQQLLPAQPPPQPPLQPPLQPYPHQQADVARAETASQQERLRLQMVQRMQQQYRNATSAPSTGETQEGVRVALSVCRSACVV